jgi:outer membrane protein TolC
MLQEAATRHTLQASAADIELQALSTYWQWSKAVAQITAYQTSVARMETQLHDTRNLKNAGLATDNDLLASEVLLDQILLQLQYALQQSDLSRIQLTQITGQPIPPDAYPKPPSIPATTLVPNLDEALGAALSNRPELASLRLNVQSSAALIAVSRAEGRPQLSLHARYEQGNPNPRDFPPEAKWQDDAFIGATLTWNLFDGGLTRARTSEAKAKTNRDTHQLQSACDSIIAETKAATLSCNYAHARLRTSIHAETSAKRNLQVATDLWKGGTARHSDVLEAQTKLTFTVAQRIAAEADLLISEATLKHTMGLPSLLGVQSTDSTIKP